MDRCVAAKASINGSPQSLNLMISCLRFVMKQRKIVELKSNFFAVRSNLRYVDPSLRQHYWILFTPRLSELSIGVVLPCSGKRKNSASEFLLFLCLLTLHLTCSTLPRLLPLKTFWNPASVATVQLFVYQACVLKKRKMQLLLRHPCKRQGRTMAGARLLPPVVRPHCPLWRNVARIQGKCSMLRCGAL